MEKTVTTIAHYITAWNSVLEKLIVITTHHKNQHVRKCSLISGPFTKWFQ
jgi:hypothetical protein